MFKEFGVLFVVFIAAVILFRYLYRKQISYYRYITIGLLLIVILVNIFYNLNYVYPTFIYEGVAIGDSEQNLFVYKKDSQFRWHILNTISHKRSILLDEQGQLFEHYFTLFAEDVEYIQIPDRIREMIGEQEEFQYQCDLSMVEQLDYAFPLWQEGEKPKLYLNEQSLQGEKELVGIFIAGNESSELYIMSARYFKSLME